jgi:DNA-binding transcriptional MocR family regulator
MLKLNVITPSAASTVPNGAAEGDDTRAVELITLSLVLTTDDNTVEGELRRSIAEGRPGDRLPSVRQLVHRHRVGPVTVQRIIDRLAHEGLVEPVPGKGTFVARRHQPVNGDWSWQTVALGARPVPGEGMAGLAADQPADVIGLATGYPDASLQALDLLATAGARAARRPGAWGRSPVEGLLALREWFASDIGGGVRPEDVVVISGGQAALSAAFRGLASPGDAVIVEAPTYAGAIDAARLAGLHLVPVGADEQGVRTDLLEAALRGSGARLVYLQPTTANPTGVTTPADRRADVLALARSHGAFVIEDDYARDLQIDGRSPTPMLHADADGHVIYVRSLTKSTAPALRIAAMVARGPARRRLRNARLVDDFFVSAVLQETALGVVTAPGWSRHLARLRRAVDERLRAGATAVEREPSLSLVTRPAGGLVLWVRLDDRIDDVALEREALERGVAVSSGRPWFCAEPTGSFVRLSVAAAGVGDVEEGVRRLGAAAAALG